MQQCIFQAGGSSLASGSARPPTAKLAGVVEGPAWEPGPAAHQADLEDHANEGPQTNRSPSLMHDVRNGSFSNSAKPGSSWGNS
ncbi:hypothetical protein PG984_009640 [Apiospora sp. TS-2023a]